MLVDQGNEPYNKSMSLGCTLEILEFIQHAMKENLLLRKYFPDISEQHWVDMNDIL